MTDKPAHPRPPMTFLQQAELLEYLHDRMSPGDDGHHAITVVLALDQPLVDDLWLTASRLRRMSPHEEAIKYLVTGK